MEKAKALSAAFTSGFASKMRLHESLAPKMVKSNLFFHSYFFLFVLMGQHLVHLTLGLSSSLGCKQQSVPTRSKCQQWMCITFPRLLSGKLKKASVDSKNVFVALAPSWTQSVARQQENRAFIYQTGHRAISRCSSLCFETGKAISKRILCRTCKNLAQGKFLSQEIFRSGGKIGRNTYSGSGNTIMNAPLQPAYNRTDHKSWEKCIGWKINNI